jgi:dipeptidyl aminopeptidase/acylaminoacyl peptidase
LERVNSPRGSGLLAAATVRSAQIATPDGRIVASLNSQAPIGWSPSGKYLASGPGDIWDRSGKRVASLPGSKDFPQWSWSPTADCFVYRDRKFIRVYLPSGDDTAFMWVGESIRTTFNFSPDGRFIALFKRNRQKYELWVVDLVGGELERLAKTGYDGGWSPDSDRIFFQLHSTLMAIEATGGTTVVYDAKLERESEAHHSDFFEGCGGRLIAARGSNIYNEADQPLVELERNGKSRRLTHDNFAYWSPSCSLDGNRLLATRSRPTEIDSKRAVVLGPRGP